MFKNSLLRTIVGIAIIFIAACSAGPNYDAPVRELSLKIELLAKEELAEGTRIADLENKLSSFSKEVASASTKLAAGGDKEKVVRSYFDATLDYFNAKQKWLDAMAAASAARRAVPTVASITSDCSVYSDPANVSRCLMQKGTAGDAAIDSATQSATKFKQASEASNTKLLALVVARDKANSLISKEAIATMDSFEALVLKSRAK